MLRFGTTLCTFAFPGGIWLAMLGYEVPALLALLTGWTAMVLLSEQGGSK